MNVKRFIAAVLSLAIVSGAMPALSNYAPDTAIVARQRKRNIPR